MEKSSLRILLFSLCITLACFFSAKSAFAGDVRYPVWAGSFYPANKTVLRETIQNLSAKAANSSTDIHSDKRLKALILPHAGYIYSGLTAAHSSLVLREGQFDKVILLGPDHRVGFENGVISNVKSYRTPLGDIPIHHEAALLRMQPELFAASAASDRSEHSLEVVLPFLQHFLGRFDLIPIVLGPSNPDTISNTITPLLTPETLLVVSSDLSHYLPYDQAKEKDMDTLSHILQLNKDALIPDNNMACGICALRTLLNIAQRYSWQPELLHYSNSGDTAGNRDNVVGYAAIAFFASQNTQNGDQTMQNELSAEQGQTLLTLARQTIEKEIGRPVSPDKQEEIQHQLKDAAFKEQRGTFVTLTKKGQLRGCIGSIAPVESIEEGIQRNAVNAAFKDHRFSPLKQEEFSDLKIEVSILTDPEPLKYSDSTDLIDKLRPGIDGVILRSGPAGATFLPQVWEQLTDTEDFLSRLCIKAGLAADSWQTLHPEILTYQVQHFNEKPGTQL